MAFAELPPFSAMTDVRIIAALPIDRSGTSNKKTIAYYESWALRRPGCEWRPEDIDVQLLTHVNYAFALVGADYRIAAMNEFDTGLYARTIALKDQNPSLKVSIAVGGWAASGPPFSNMARTQERRAVFIQSVIDLMDTYGFDGIDLDWEYPVAPDRDGAPEDKENYVHLVRELRRALPVQKEITVAIPASNWYLRHFDVEAMAEHIDWFNIMSYDIHGTWDGNSEWSHPVVQPHTNLTEIDDGLDLLWRNNIKPSQVVMGLGFYGRSFTLQDPSCTEPMCPFSGGAEAGYCMDTSGVLSNAEIRRVLDRTGVEPTLDREAGIKYISWEGQWVSYDDGETLALKTQFANNRCLGGKMIWAVDLDEPGSPTLQALVSGGSGSGSGGGSGGSGGLPGGLPGVKFKGLSVRAALRVDRDLKMQNEAAATMILTDCGESCPTGWHAITGASGVWAGSGKDVEECMLNRGSRVMESHNVGRGKRSLCVPDNIEVEGCSWVGRPLFCSPPTIFDAVRIRGVPASGGCPKGSVHLANNNMPPSEGDESNPKECFPGTYAAFCCKKVESKLSKRWCDEMDFGGLLVGGGLAGVLRIRGIGDKIRRRSSNLGSEMDWDPVLPGMFDGYDGCNGQRYGDMEDLEMMGYHPYNLPQGSDFVWPGLDDDDDDESGDCTTTVTRSTTETTSTTVTKECNVVAWPQACHNYVSIAKHWFASGHNPAAQSDHLLCPWEYLPGATARRSVPQTWNNEHSSWRQWLAKPGSTTCERDEYPFIRFIGAPNPPVQYLRVLPKSENGPAGNHLVNRVCPITMESETEVETITGGSRTCYVSSKTTKTQVVLSIGYNPWDAAWENTAIWDDHLPRNPCLPSINFNDPGFALLTGDPWYRTGAGVGIDSARYRQPPPVAVTQGHILPRRKLEDGDIYFSDDDGFGIVDERNRSRRATPEELRKHLGLLPCRSPDCIEEKAALGLDVNGNPMPISLEATVTAVDPMEKETGNAEGSLPAMTGGSFLESFPTPTTMAPATLAP
ncbi:Acidic mammalian chitinase [Colletotrichum sidae]|uniref:chitinase n=1 Tax=Colletotrichum sidae TaxID=1347389 RepID=A0A4R8TGV8_9PEZI|nr:Acidic mammalian chitinase [Colletotrichum sidae]